MHLLVPVFMIICDFLFCLLTDPFRENLDARLAEVINIDLCEVMGFAEYAMSLKNDMYNFSFF